MNKILKRGPSSPIVREDRVPEVIVDFEYDYNKGDLLFIIVQNIGFSSAYNISVKFDNELIGAEADKKVSEMSIFKRLEFLPPGKRIQIFVDTFLSYLRRRQPLVVNATVTYSNKNKQKFQDVIKHDLSIYKEMMYVH